MDKITVNLDKLKQQLASLKDIADKDKWIYFYEKMLDQLSYAPKIIKADYSLFSITDEYSVYIDRKSNLKGIFIEYFKSNLLVHEKELKELMGIFTQENDGSFTVPKSENNRANLLSDALQAKILSQVVKNNKTGEIQIPV